MTRYAIVFATALAAAGALFPALVTMPRMLVWNASASVPIGLYRIDRGAGYSTSELIAVESPEPLAAFLAGRGYLPKGVLLLKRILAVPGQTVCRNRLTISVEGIEVGVALERDRAGRDLPTWEGCRRIPAGAVFLMNRQVPDSLDGRYFGLVSTNQIIGRAIPLWTDEQGGGRFPWRVPAR